MNTKKIISLVITAVLGFQCLTLPAFASDPGKPEEIYSLIQSDNGEYGFMNYSFVDENGNPVEFEVEDPTDNRINTLSSDDTDLPTEYSLRDLGLVTDARVQGVTSNCWAFSALGALESNRLIQGSDNPDFSEAHLVWFAHNSYSSDLGDGINRSNVYNQGGNWMLSAAALSRWSGTVKETDYPFYPYEPDKMGNYSEEERYSTSGGAILNSAESLTNMAEIKSWIMKNGAVEANYYANNKFLNINESKYSYYCNDSSLTANHAILIVGWDDYYSKSNFKSSIRPAYPGAFLCKNSWGDSWGDGGYFWISYFDATISGIMGYTCVDSDTYDNNYTYNGLGYNIAYKNSSANGSQIANVFTSNGHETLSAISTYTIQSDTFAEIFIYKSLPENYSKPNQGTLVYSSGKSLIKNAGYHTISIDNPVSLAPDEIFSVIIRFSNSSDSVYVVGERNSGSSAAYTSKPRQSYIDLSGTNSSWYDSSNYDLNNNCIQAFTVCEHQPYEIASPSSCENGRTVTSYCSQCGDQLSSHTYAPSGHVFSGWTTTKQATKNSEGEKARVCEVCHYTETRALPCLSQSHGKPVTLNEFFEILRMWINEFIMRISENL